METQQEPEGNDGVYVYTVRPTGKSKGVIVETDAAMVASFIAARIAAGERTAGDFMVLTMAKAPIERYARALSERNVPVATSGASLPQEHELRELLIVLRAIADPASSIAVVAALEGLFFGLSPADLWHASQRGLRFSATHRAPDDADATARALQQLHEWWTYSRRHPADVLIERILDDSGLLLHAAALPLGEARAGALLHLLSSLRESSVSGGNGLPDAMERLAAILGAEASDAPLRPGRTDAVRVMNLHKAKGLEADVVMLAAPVDRTVFEPNEYITRAATGRTSGGLCIVYSEGSTTRVLAHPPRWDEMKDAEMRFGEAEKTRLLYVAATRAKREMYVAQCEIALAKGLKPDDSMWRPLAAALDEHAIRRAMMVTPAPGRKQVVRSAASLREATDDAATRVRAAAAASLRFVTVTEQAKETLDDPSAAVAGLRGEGLGTAWGTAVHRSIEALGRGRRGDSLRAFVRAVAVDEGLSGELSDALYPLIERMAASEVWQSLMSTGEMNVELAVMGSATVQGVETITEGVADAAVLGAGGWTVMDWKTDAVDDTAWRVRLENYTRQVNAYAELLATLSDRPAVGRLERVRL